jgi:hypothetical protein
MTAGDTSHCGSAAGHSDPPVDSPSGQSWVRVDEAFRPAIDVRLDDGVLPTGHTDLAALTNVGPRELDRLRQSSETPKANWRRGQQCRAARPRLSTCTVHRPIPVRANPITLDSSRSGPPLGPDPLVAFGVAP